MNLGNVLKPEAGWYRGDFHAHTHFSDGCYSPPELADVARAEGLDFFTITDHNTVDAFHDFGSQPDILIIPGIEVTLKEGHFNVFGVEGIPDWLKQIRTGRNTVEFRGDFDTFTRMMQQADREGLLNSINHPALTPWAWLDRATDLRHLHCLEIWNDPSWPDNAQANPQAVALWTQWLNAGHRITAIGGTDYHCPQPKPGHSKSPERLSLPSTYVYAKELSGAAVLAGLRRRRAYVSIGPQVVFQAHLNGATYEIGDDLGEVDGVIEFKVLVAHNSAVVKAQLVKNGCAVAEALGENGQASFQWRDYADPSQPRWYRLDVLDQEGELLAVTNPVFVGPRRDPTHWNYGGL